MAPIGSAARRDPPWSPVPARVALSRPSRHFSLPPCRPRPLSAGTRAVVKLATRLDKAGHVRCGRPRRPRRVRCSTSREPGRGGRRPARPAPRRGMAGVRRASGYGRRKGRTDTAGRAAELDVGVTAASAAPVSPTAMSSAQRHGVASASAGCALRLRADWGGTLLSAGDCAYSPGSPARYVPRRGPVNLPKAAFRLSFGPGSARSGRWLESSGR